MAYFLAVLCIFIILYGRFLYNIWITHRHMKRLSARIPGDEGLPIIGNMYDLGRTSESLPRDLLARSKTARETFDGQMLKLWLVHQCAFFPFTGEVLQHIIESKDEIDKLPNYDYFEAWLGRALLLAGGDRWRAKRKMLTPSFHFTQLLGYIDTMNVHAKMLSDVLEDRCDKEVDVYPYLKRLTLDVICDTAMGKHLDSLHQPDLPYVKLMWQGFEASMNPFLWNRFGRWITGWQKEQDANVKIAHDLTMEVITERVELLARGEVHANKKAFLDLLLLEKERCNLSMEDIREEVDTFMFAGHDTTSTALGWTLWCLANHPGIQERAFDEVKEIFEDDMDRDCSKDDLGRMHYIERCIKESLRLFPSVPFTGRLLQEDFQMGPYLLPRGSSLVISPYLVHRNERIYPNPDVYDPDRFLPENVAKRHPYDYIPFSAGPRNCIGQKFAMNLLKITLSWLLRRYRFRSERDFEIRKLIEVVLTAEEGINVIIESR